MKLKKKNLLITLLNVVLYLINPFIATITSLLFSIIIKSRYSIKILIINISLFFGLLNATKFIEGDLFAYHNYFINGPQKSLIDFLSQFQADYLYYFVTYIAYFILFHSWELFIILITFFSYLFIFKSAEIILSRAKGIKTIDIILGLLIVAMFYPLFSFSAHLVRNFIAAAIILYFVTNYFFKNKNLWYFLPITISIHASATMFIISYFVPKKMSFKNIMRMLFFIMLFLLAIFILLELLGYGIFENLYVYSRIVNYSGFKTLLSFQDTINILLVTIFIIFFSRINKINILTTELSRYLLFLIIILSIGYALSSNPVIEGRILFYNYFLGIPLFLTVFIRRGMFFRIVNMIILCIFTVFFIQNLLYGTWIYIDGSEIITGNIFDYFNVKNGG